MRTRADALQSGFNSCIFYLKDFDLIWILQSSSLRLTAQAGLTFFCCATSTSPWPLCNSHPDYESCHRHKNGNHLHCSRVCFSISFFNKSTDGKLEASRDPNKSIAKTYSQINRNQPDWNRKHCYLIWSHTLTNIIHTDTQIHMRSSC